MIDIAERILEMRLFLQVASTATVVLQRGHALCHLL